MTGFFLSGRTGTAGTTRVLFNAYINIITIMLHILVYKVAHSLISVDGTLGPLSQLHEHYNKFTISN